MDDSTHLAAMPALFISDLHLSPQRPAIVDLFLRFLADVAAQADRLYILGDLFEYWAGDDDLESPFNQSIAAALAARSHAGTELFFLHGNRDFLIGKAFARAAGLTLLEDPVRVELADGPALLSHGDVLCTEDQEYQAFRTRVRSQAWIDAFLARPLDDRKREIEALRLKSESEKRVKPAEIMDVTPRAVDAFFHQQDCTRLIHGHTHRPTRHEHWVDGRQRFRWVLADWYDSGSYLHSDTQGINVRVFR